MEDMERFIAGDRFARHLGIEVTAGAPGKASAVMDITDHHLNSAGTVHGGAVFSLADAAFAVASNSHGTLALAINVSISYLKGAAAGRLTAEAEEVAVSTRLGTYLITVRDEAGSTVALFQGTVYRKSARIADSGA